MTANKITSRVTVGLVAALLLSTSTAALHAQDRDLQKELDQLKAQINSLKSAINEQRSETRKNREKIKVVADRSVVPPVSAPGYTTGGFQPIGGYDDKKFHFGGITITPGGYVAAEGFFRSKTTQSGISTAYNAIPFSNSLQSKTNETKFSVQQTRVALLVEGSVSPSILASGYIETDFQGAGTSSNDNQSYSFVPRARNIYANVDFLDTGFHVLAGQNWSLVTLNSKGITPRNEVTPAGIDGQPAPGFYYTRQPQIRITKDFDKKLWLSLSAEAAATTFAANCANTVNNTGVTTFTTPTAAAAGTATTALAGNTGLNAGTSSTCLLNGTGSNFGQAGQNQQVSLNHIPDVIGKVAYEAVIADRSVHFEGFGMARDFYSAANYGGGNVSAKDNYGFSYGGGIVANIIPKRLDFTGQVLAGYGIGRYAGSGSSAGDAILNPDGSVKPIKGIDAMVGLTFHATPQLDIYAYAGMEQQEQTLNFAGGVVSGLGLSTVNNSGCNGVVGGVCNAQQRRLSSITAGLWDKVYEGKFGYLRAGAGYAYIKRDGFGSTFGGVYTQPHTDDHMIYTSLRFYPF